MATELNKIMVIASGPVNSAQPTTSPAETDLTCRKLVEAGKDVILLTANPNIFRSHNPHIHYYISPLTAAFVSQVIRRTRPDAILPSAGGQIALNIMREIGRSGILTQFGVTVLGTGVAAIEQTEDGEKLRRFLKQANIPTPESTYVENESEALTVADGMGYPVLMRRGQTRNIARSRSELDHMIGTSIGGGRILIERAIYRFKHVQLVMMRDGNGSSVLLGTIESLDPVGVNPANTVVFAPAQTLADRDRTALRAAAKQVLQKLGVRGCATISFALDPKSSDWYMLKVKTGLTWTSSLIARATAYPVAGVNTAIALGEALEDIHIGLDRQMIAAIEPGIDAIVARFPQFPRELQTGARLGPQLVAGGAIMTAGRTLPGVLMQGLYLLGHDEQHVLSAEIRQWDEDTLTGHIIQANALRLPAIWLALERGFTVSELSELSRINPLFISAVQQLLETYRLLPTHQDEQTSRLAKMFGFNDNTIAAQMGVDEADYRAAREKQQVLPTYKTLDAMGQIKPETPTFYASYENENESERTDLPGVLVIEPNAAAPWLNAAHESISSAMLAAIRDAGCTPILVGSTPRPLVYPGVKHYLMSASLEHLLDVIAIEQPLGVICQTAGREGSRLAHMLQQRGITVLGSVPGRHPNRLPQSAKTALEALSDADWTVKLGEDTGEDPHSTHLAIDAIADGTDVAVLGVINSLEENESRAGKVIAVTPPRKGARPMTEKATAVTVALGKALALKGFVHLDMVISGQDMIVTFVGPSASATVPFLAKTLRRDCIAIACGVLLGKTLAEQGIASGQLAQSPGVHVLLPVLRSGLTAPGSKVATIEQTGLVMGSDQTLGKALIKSFAAAHEPLPDHGTVLLETGTEAATALTPRLTNLGFQIVTESNNIQLANVDLIVMDKPSIELRRLATAHMVPLLNIVSADAILQVYEARAFALTPLDSLEEE